MFSGDLSLQELNSCEFSYDISCNVRGYMSFMSGSKYLTVLPMLTRCE